MLEGTERDVVELVLVEPMSPTEVAESLDVSVQTASRTLRQLVEEGFARETRATGSRGYKHYEATEFATVFAGFDGRLFEDTLELTPEKRAVLSVWQVPQAEFHPVLLSYLFGASEGGGIADSDVVGIVVYGSVARGDARPDSDVDILLVTAGAGEAQHGRSRLSEEGWLAFGERRVISEELFTEGDFRDALEARSGFLRNVLSEGIVLYDPNDVIQDARQGRAGERVSA